MTFGLGIVAQTRRSNHDACINIAAETKGCRDIIAASE
jgi:hypothetical protein